MLARLGITAPLGLGPALIAYTALVVAAAWIVRERVVQTSTLEFTFTDALRARLHAALLAMEWRSFLRRPSAMFTQAMMEDADHAGFGLHEFLLLTAALIEIPVLLTVSLVLSPMLTLSSIILGLLAVTAAHPINQRTFTLGSLLQRVQSALHVDLADDLAGMRVVRSHGVEQARHARFIARTADLQVRRLDYVRSSSIERALSQSIAAAATALSVAVAVYVLAIPLADVLVLVVAFGRLASTGMSFLDGYRNLLQWLPNYASFTALLADCRQAAEPMEGCDIALSFEHALSIDQIVYRYAADAPPALDRVSLEIPARGLTAIIGPSGAGKSTLADIILGLLAPDSGQVLIDGKPLDGVARKAWRQRVGYVPQDGFLFHDTIRANLKAVAPESGEADLWSALEMAAADNFVRALPLGLDSVVGDRGGNLSGGERQRLTLARAFLRRPALLVLDEPTSALDSDSERRILGALERQREHMAVVVITHRPSTARISDTVIVLETGRVIACGPLTSISAEAAPSMTQSDIS
jgi:ATP-binding cassette subfamily C protein